MTPLNLVPFVSAPLDHYTRQRLAAMLAELVPGLKAPPLRDGDPFTSTPLASSSNPKVDLTEILAVNANLELSDIQRMVLPHAGYKVVSADRGKEALRPVDLATCNLSITVVLLPRGGHHKRGGLRYARRRRSSRTPASRNCPAQRMG